jgi:ADP-ribose pyrophosphatase YjhB (NUDIX family)
MGVYNSVTTEYSHVILIVFRVDEYTGEPLPGDDAEDLDWFEINDLPPLAFDAHTRILSDLREKYGNT